LRYAAEHADVVGLSGLGRTLEDGHRHEVRWAPEQISAAIDHIHDDANAAGRDPKLEALVQHVELTDDAEVAARKLTTRLPGLTVEQVLAAPFVWLAPPSRSRRGSVATTLSPASVGAILKDGIEARG